MSKKAKQIIPAHDLLSAYAEGIFPMAESKEVSEVQWYTAILRGVIPMDTFKVSKNVIQLAKKKSIRITRDEAFKNVMKACANRDSSWISTMIIDSYYELHKLGFAHSIEVWNDDKLVGGLYGVRLGKAFFGESMFKTEKEMDKVALLHCHKWLKEWNCEVWDTQFYTEHLAQFGCIEISAESYRKRLDRALIEILG